MVEKQAEEPGSPQERSQNRLNTRRSAAQKTHPWWWIVSAITIAVIIALLTLDLLNQVGRPLALLILGITLAAALSPVAEFFSRKMPRGVAIVLVYFLLILFFFGIGWLIIPPLVDQAQELGNRVPEWITQIQDMLQRWGGITGVSLTQTLVGQLGNISSVLVSLPIQIASSLLEIIVILFISLYGLIAAPEFKRFVASLFPERRAEEAIGVLTNMVNAMGGFIRGTAMDGIILGFLAYIGLLIIGIDFALVLGILTAVLAFIPVLGALISGAVMVGIAFLESPSQAVIVLLFIILLQQFEGNVLLPNIMRGQTNVSPLLSVMALIVGSAVGGLLGALSAIPIAAASKVLILDVFAPSIRQMTSRPKDVPEETE